MTALRGAERLPVLEDLPPLAGRKVLLRADLNVPLRQNLDGSSSVVDDFRIRVSLPTIEWLLAHDAQVTVCSHLGRPAGKPDPRYSMDPVREVMRAVAPGVEVMENLRFSPGEEANDPAFVASLVDGFDAYVNDAFGACHRAHASIVGPPEILPSAAGRLLAAEVAALEHALFHPAHPFIGVIGGAKVADKLGVLRALAERTDRLLIGGAMCFTFLAALGHTTGASHVEPELIDAARELLEAVPGIELPDDFIAIPAAQQARDGAAEPRTVGRDVPTDWKGVDLGPDSRAKFTEHLEEAKTVLWNDPMGIFEDARFAAGTAAVASAIAQGESYSLVGGGDTVAAVHALGLAERFTHLSSGGGATLEFVEHGDLPGLAALRRSTAR